MTASARYERRIVTGVLAGYGGTIAARLLALVSLPLTLSLLRVDLFGLWALLSIAIGSQNLFDLGVTASTAKYVATADRSEDRALAVRTLWRGAVVYLVLSALFTTAVLVLDGWLLDHFGIRGPERDDAQLLMYAAIPVFGLTNFFGLFAAALQGMQRLKEVNVISATSQLLLVGALLAVSATGATPVPGVLVASVGVALFQMLSAGVVCFQHLPRQSGAQASVPMRSFVSLGAASQALAVSSFFLIQGPKLMIAGYFGVRAAAEFDLATRIPLLGVAAVSPLLPPLLPTAAKFSIEDRPIAVERLHGLALRAVLFVALPYFLAAATVGPLVLPAWVGDAGASLAHFVVPLSIAFFFFVAAAPTIEIAVGRGRLRLVICARLAGSMVTAAGLLYVGSSGSANNYGWPVAAGCFCAFAVLAAGTWKPAIDLLGLWLLGASAAIGTVVATGVAASVDVFLPSAGALMVGAIAGLVSYLTACLSLGALPIAELRSALTPPPAPVAAPRAPLDASA